MPVYLARTASVPLADFSTQVLRDIRDGTHDIPDDATVVIIDDRSTKINVASAFGSLLNDAVLLTTGRRLNMWIEPQTPGTEGVEPPCESCVALRLRVVNGRLERLSFRGAAGNRSGEDPTPGVPMRSAAVNEDTWQH